VIKVANLVFNSFVNDSRVKKESESLGKHGFYVEVIGYMSKNLNPFEKNRYFNIRRFSYLDNAIGKSRVFKLKAYFLYVKKSFFYCKEFDILHCNDLHTLPIGVLIKTFLNKNVKIVYDAHEYETEVGGLKGFQKMVAKAIESLLIRYADGVITVSDSIANEYVRLYNIEKPALVLNTPPYKEIENRDLFRESFDIRKDQIIFLYQGGLSSGRGIEILLDTFKMVDDEKSVIVFMGYGPLEDIVKQASNEFENIYFHEAVSPDILLDYTSSADFGISTIEDSCLSYRYCLPNKMFEYLMANLPVIVSNLYEMKRLVENNKIGVVAKENTPEGLSEAIKKATKLDKQDLKANIQKVKEIYNWEEQEKVLLNLYKELWK
jgi:glycosyltransferase involved in cell wall biosynthesis